MSQYFLNHQEFLTNERFWNWVQNPDDAVLKQYWNHYQTLFPEQKSAMLEARTMILESINQNNLLSKSELKTLWDRIQNTINISNS